MIKQIAVALVGIVTVTGSLRAQNPGPGRVPEAAPGGPAAATVPAETAPFGADVPQGEALPVAFEEAPPFGGFWATSDYMVGWVHGGKLPPLITTSPASTPLTNAGVLGLPTTAVVLGNQNVNDLSRSGARFQIGYMNPGPTPAIGVEAGVWFLQEQNTSFVANSNGSTILARPFLDAVTKTQVATRIAFPGISSGSIAVDVPSEGFTSVNVDMSKRFYTSQNLSIEGMAGYRLFNFGDSVQVQSNLTTLGGGGFAPGIQVAAMDQFIARNTFNGGEMGFRGKYVYNRFSLDMLGKLALGEMHQTVTAFGSTVTNIPGSPPVISSGGLLALDTNSRTITKNNDWTLATELGFNTGWRLTDHMTFRAGYTFLWWDGVARAADQIDPVVNQNHIPPVVVPTTGPPRPALHVENTDLIVQALNFGLEFRY